MADSNSREAQHQALIEGFINMSATEGLREEQEAQARRQRSSGYEDVDLASKKAGPLEGEPTGFDEDDVDEDSDDVQLKYEVKENSNIYKSAAHVFKANVGSAIFMLPTFYPDAGYILGIILALAIGFCVVDCTRLLIRTKVRINRRDVTTYSQLCRFVCGPVVAWILLVALCVTQYGFCLMFSQLFSASMDELAKFSDKAHYLWVSIVLVVCFPFTCFSDNLSILAITSIIASVCVAYAIVCCLVDNIQNLASNGVSDSITAAGRTYPLGWFKNLANNMMSLEGIAVILPVHASCKDKKRVPLMASIVIGCIICIYLVFGLTGYLAHGLDQSTSIIANMPMNAWGKSIRGIFVVNLVFSYPLQFMSAQQQIDMVFKCKPRSWVGLGLRVFFNLVVWALAMGLPASAVNTVVAFIGAIPSCCMVLLLPSLMTLQVDYAVAHPDESRSTWHYWKVLLIGAETFKPRSCFTLLRIKSVVYIIAGFLVMIIGTIGIIEGLIQGESASH